MSDWSKLHYNVVFDKSNGKIIWQPEIGCWYTDKIFAGQPLPDPYTNMTLPEVYEFNSCFKRVEDVAVQKSQHSLNETDTEITIETPVGKQIAVHRRSSNNPGTIHVRVFTLTKCARRIIDLFAPRLVLGISDEVSSTGDIERIRIVGNIVEKYNAQAEKRSNKTDAGDDK